jgi:hypothetical protein
MPTSVKRKSVLTCLERRARDTENLAPQSESVVVVDDVAAYVLGDEDVFQAGGNIPIFERARI